MGWCWAGHARLEPRTHCPIVHLDDTGCRFLAAPRGKYETQQLNWHIRCCFDSTDKLIVFVACSHPCPCARKVASCCPPAVPAKPRSSVQCGACSGSISLAHTCSSIWKPGEQRASPHGCGKWPSVRCCSALPRLQLGLGNARSASAAQPNAGRRRLNPVLAVAATTLPGRRQNTTAPQSLHTPAGAAGVAGPQAGQGGRGHQLGSGCADGQPGAWSGCGGAGHCEAGRHAQDSSGARGGKHAGQPRFAAAFAVGAWAAVPGCACHVPRAPRLLRPPSWSRRAGHGVPPARMLLRTPVLCTPQEGAPPNRLRPACRRAWLLCGGRRRGPSWG